MTSTIDDSNGTVSHGNNIENASTKFSSLMSELQQQQHHNPHPPNLHPSHRPLKQQLGGLLACMPKTGRHYVYNRAAWIAAEKERSRQCCNTTSLHCLSKKQQRRWERRQQQLKHNSVSDNAPLDTTTTDSISSNSCHTTGTIRTVSLRDCLLYHKENSTCTAAAAAAAAAAEMETTATTTTTAPAKGSGTASKACAADPRINVVICLALLDPQHQPWSRQVLSRLVPLCAATADDEPEPDNSRQPPIKDNDDNVTDRIHGWVLLQSAMSSQYIDYCFAHSGLTVLVCDNDNVPKKTNADSSSDDTVTPVVVDPATAAAKTPCAQLLLSPAPLSPWLWTALGMHHCPAVTILDGHTGRRCQTQQDLVLLDAKTGDEAIRKAWLSRPSSNDGISLSLQQISTCTVQ
jgi:hypothetical protein